MNMCGIGAIVPKNIDSTYINNISTTAKDIHLALTERGTSSCGLTVIENEQDPQSLRRMRYGGHFADATAMQKFYEVLNRPQKLLAQTRFTTNGEDSLLNAQPIIVYTDDNDESINVFNGSNIHPPYAKDSFEGNNVLCLAHNGEIRIPKKDKIFSERDYFFDDSENQSDSMLLAAYLLSGLMENEGDLAKTMKDARNDVSGTYSIIADTNVDGFEGLFAYRCGRRPLAIAETDEFFAFASETGHLVSSGIEDEYVKTIEPGVLHTLIYENDLISHKTKKITDKPSLHCFFEGPVYLQNHLSVCDSLPPQMFDPSFIEVLKEKLKIEDYNPSEDAINKSQKNHPCMTARELIGQWLFRLRGDEIPEAYSTIAGVPRSGLSVADGFSMESIIQEVPIIKRELITAIELRRDFLNDQKEREKTRPKKLEYRDMPDYLILGEDSVVTSRNILDVIENCYNKGVENIIVIIGSPPIMKACYDGINMKYGHQFPQKLYPDVSGSEIYNKVVNNLNLFEKDAAKYLGIEKVIYMPLKPIEMLLGPAYSYGCVGSSGCNC
ncbi:MAG: hypothetical protein KAS90_04050 [Candidatus Aenigmarchaeota archaeon]|nr:hypothetical protein [Candidatus Aenigmarchaeota archaeon]